MSAAVDGREANQAVSLRYTLHRWRRTFKGSYRDMCDTPIDVIMTDLEYMEVEEQIKRGKQSR